jgi:hypothetical protein
MAESWNWPTDAFDVCFHPNTLNARPPLWSSDQSSWLQIQRSGFDSRRYQIFWIVVGLERGPLSLVSTIEELLGRKSSGSSLENRDYVRRDPWRFLPDTLYSQTLALISPTRGGRSVGIVFSQTQATEFSFSLFYIECLMWETGAPSYEHQWVKLYSESLGFWTLPSSWMLNML